MDADRNAMAAKGGWAELLQKPYGARLTALSAGIGLHAFNEIAIAPVIPMALDALAAPHLLPFVYAAFFLLVITGGLTAAPLRRKLGARAGLLLAGALYLAAVATQSLAPSAPVLLVGRALQGLSDGWIVALCYSLIADLFPARLVPRVFSVEAIIWALAAVLGPLAGGFTAEWVHWRAALAVSLPFILILFAVLPMALPAGQKGQADTPQKQGQGRRRLLPPKLFGFSTTAGRGSWLLFLMSVAQSVSAVFLAYGLRHIFGLPAAAAGLTVVTLALTWSVVAMPVAGLKSLASKRRAVRFGPLFQALGCGLIATGFYTGFLPLVVAGQVSSGAAFGMLWATANQAIIEDADPEHRMTTGSLLPSIATCGSVFGSSVIGGLASSAGVIDRMAGDAPHWEALALWGTAACISILALIAAQGIRPKATE